MAKALLLFSSVLISVICGNLYATWIQPTANAHGVHLSGYIVAVFILLGIYGVVGMINGQRRNNRARAQ